MKPYRAGIGSDERHYVDGPGNGCDYYSGTLWPNMRMSTKEDAEAAALIANEAYRQGCLRAQANIRAAMGSD